MTSFSALPLTPSLTELINTCHTRNITKAQRKFLQIAYDVNAKQKTSFCVEDFRENGYSDTQFRQYVFQLKDIIIIENKSNPVFYKLRGITLSTYDKKITDKGMMVGIHMLENNLKQLKGLIAMMHDIALKFKSDNLHILLQNNGYPSDTSNSMIKLKHFFDELDSDVTFCIYPKSVQIHLASTYNPIIHDPDGILKLGMILGHVRQYLIGKSQELANIPLCEDWTVYHYHLNKDGPACSGKAFEITVSDFDSTMMRFYKKRMSDGTTKNRIEAIQTPNISVNKLFRETLGLDKGKNNITININGGFTSL